MVIATHADSLGSLISAGTLELSATASTVVDEVIAAARAITDNVVSTTYAHYSSRMLSNIVDFNAFLDQFFQPFLRGAYIRAPFDIMVWKSQSTRRLTASQLFVFQQQVTEHFPETASLCQRLVALLHHESLAAATFTAVDASAHDEVLMTDIFYSPAVAPASDVACSELHVARTTMAAILRVDPKAFWQPRLDPRGDVVYINPQGSIRYKAVWL
jgi:hypothetical protein